jgi:hypothetical protein
VLAVILAEKFGVMPSVILDQDLGDVLKWTTILSDLNTQKGGKYGG